MNARPLRKHQQGACALRLQVFQTEKAGVPVNVMQTLADIAQTDSGSPLASLGTSSQSGVFNRDDDIFVADGSQNSNRSAGYFGPDPMLDGILHQRLQDHRRYAQLSQRRIHIEAVRQPLLEAGLFNFQIGLEESQFVFQRDP